MFDKDNSSVPEKLAFQFHKTSNLLRRFHGSQLGEAKQAKKDGKVTHSIRKRGSRSQHALLRMLMESDGVAQHDIVEALDIQPSSASVLVDKLAEAGLVRREGDAADKRAVKVFITDAGKKHVEDTAAEHASRSAELFVSLSADEQTQLANLLDKLIASLKEQGAQRGIEVAHRKS